MITTKETKKYKSIVSVNTNKQAIRQEYNVYI